MISQLKRPVKSVIQRFHGLNPDHSQDTEQFGEGYGSWELVTDSADESSVVYSFGVGEEISFDLGLIEKYGATIHAFDPTPRSIQWVESQDLPEQFVMHGFGLASTDGELDFNPPENDAHVSHTLLDRPATNSKSIIVSVKRLSTIMKELGHDHIDILKMDIEGAEYSVIDDMLSTDIRPQQFLVEFHHRFQNVGINQTKMSVRKLRRAGYKLISVSESGEEFLFNLTC